MSATLDRWQSLPDQIRAVIRGLTPRQMDRSGGSEGWTIREYVHHLVEANLVVSTIVLAGLGRAGSTYDWSWLIPDNSWNQALGYRRVPVDQALQLFEAVVTHIATLVEATPRALSRHIYLVGSRGRRERRTVAMVLAAEVAHARQHLADISAIRRSSDFASRPTRRRGPN